MSERQHMKKPPTPMGKMEVTTNISRNISGRHNSQQSNGAGADTINSFLAGKTETELEELSKAD